jgi:hypothetical protein
MSWLLVVDSIKSTNFSPLIKKGQQKMLSTDMPYVSKLSIIKELFAFIQVMMYFVVAE